MNGPKGGFVANAAIVPAGTGGAINAFVTDDSDLMIDINGYFDTTVTPGATAFYPLSPCRVADTRNPNGALGGPQIAAGTTRDFPISTSNCIPGNVGIQSYSLNVTAIPTQPLASVAVWMGQTQRPPLVSTLSASFGDVTAVATIAQAGSNSGDVNVFASDQTDVALDINGYFGAPAAPGALLFQPVTPCRVVDTRSPNGPFGGPILLGGTTRTITVPSSTCNIPATAKAYSLNVTVVPSSPLGYLTIWPTGQAQPFVSTLNSWDGRIVANAAIVPAGQNGAVSVYVSDNSHVVIDVNGYFAAP